jgi:hypothetical protein
LDGVVIGLAGCVGLTVLAVVLISRGSGSPPASRDAPPAPTATAPQPTAPPEPTTLPGPVPTEAPPSPTVYPVSPDGVPGRAIGEPTNLREGPGLDWPIAATVPAGTALSIIGRWADWYQVAWADAPGGAAWAFADLVQVDGDASLIPTVEPPPPPESMSGGQARRRS